MEPITLLQNKRIILAATGSIAVYKAVDLASKLTQAGALVDVIMTEAAQRFVTPLTFQAVTGRPVYTSMWETEASEGLPTHIAHVGLGEGADLIAVVPATANTIARLAQGASDDLLTVTALAARCPLLIAPAMDGGMYEHPATQANLKTLVERGVHLIEPEVGRFASGLTGRGRLPDTQTLIGHIRQRVAHDAPLAGQRVVITAGPSKEPLDPVRYLTNYSSGKQGHALAQAAIDAGADVTLITSVDLPVPMGVEVVRYEAAQMLHNLVVNNLTSGVILIMAAAVADYRPAVRSTQKIKKNSNAFLDDPLTLKLEQNQDILLSVGQRLGRIPNYSGRHNEVIVGFAAESENLLNNARIKMERKGLDMIIANDITAPDAGFAHDTNRVHILSLDRDTETLEVASKTKISERIIERIVELVQEQ